MAEAVKDDADSAAGGDAQQGSKQGLLQAPFFVPVVFDPASGIPMIPLYPSPQADNPQQGIFAVPMLPFGAGSSSLPPIPLTYNSPLGIPYGEGPESGAAENGAQQAADGAPRADQQRVVVRRFRVGIQLDLLLIVKLVTMVFIFSQDGSRDRLLLLFLASVVYLYQTGALTPILRWASERARRAMMPPLQVANVPREPPQLADDAGPVVGDGNLAGPAAGGDGAQVGPTPAQDAARDEQEAAGEAQVPHVDEQQQQQVHVGYWQGFVREVQMVVVGFVTSLLPGFHNID